MYCKAPKPNWKSCNAVFDLSFSSSLPMQTFVVAHCVLYTRIYFKAVLMVYLYALIHLQTNASVHPKSLIALLTTFVIAPNSSMGTAKCARDAGAAKMLSVCPVLHFSHTSANAKSRSMAMAWYVYRNSSHCA